jgi:hypothetical protein
VTFDLRLDSIPTTPKDRSPRDELTVRLTVRHSVLDLEVAGRVAMEFGPEKSSESLLAANASAV